MRKFMPEEFKVTLPKLGESIMNATVVQWFKKEGEVIKKDEPLLEVSTDKVNSEIPSPVSGIVKKIHANLDQDLNVGDLLATIELKEGNILPLSTKESKKEIATETPSTEMQGYYSPALVRLAREQGISYEELETIPGSGTGGRITKKDLETYIASKKSKPCKMASKAKTFAEGDIEHIKMTGMRKAIAENMVRSFYEAPHASLVNEVDLTNVVKAIKEAKESFQEKYGVKLTLSSFVARAIARALSEYPLLNSSLENDTIVLKRFVNLGIAVSVEQGIMVPVIKHCQTLRLHEISKAIADLAQKARNQTLNPEDVQGGTITMTNFGMSGVQIGIPIIRFPEVAIIGMGAITKKVMALEEDLFGIREMMYISLTFDHRVIDGMYGCGFLNALKKHLESDLSVD